MCTLEVLIAESRGDQRPSECLSNHHASLVSAYTSSSTAGNDRRLVTVNCHQLASPEEFTITVGGCYVRVKNREFALSNRNMDLKIGRVGSPAIPCLI